MKTMIPETGIRNEDGRNYEMPMLSSVYDSETALAITRAERMTRFIEDNLTIIDIQVIQHR